MSRPDYYFRATACRFCALSPTSGLLITAAAPRRLTCGAWPVSMAAEVVQQTELFTDIFEITDKDPDGKKFDKGVSCAWWLLL